jgi:hypothetical protein
MAQGIGKWAKYDELLPGKKVTIVAARSKSLSPVPPQLEMERAFVR